jgi:hypothetical protein
MKKTILTSIFALFLSISFAQDNGKTSIAIIPFTYSPDGNVTRNGPQIIWTISAAFDESKRFTIVPTANWGMPQDATESQYTSQAKDIGVNYLITGSVDRVPATRYPIKDSYGNVTGNLYSARVFFSIKVINVETGTVFSSKSFDAGSGFLHTVSTEAAIFNAIKNADADVKKWINETFPVNIGLMKIIKKDAKGGALSILISAGSESGISEGKGGKNKLTKFKIVEYVTETFDGKSMKRTVQIGSAQVDKVDDANFTECTVTDGKMDVAKKFDAGDKLFLITIN